MAKRILWVCGNSGAGKSTLAEWVWNHSLDSIWLDADVMRKVWPGLGFSQDDRYEQNFRLARLASVLVEQGFDVIISSICPYRDLRKKIKSMLPDVQFAYLSGGKPSSEMYPYEEPDQEEKNGSV
jgi:adenylylsulfate kinase